MRNIRQYFEVVGEIVARDVDLPLNDDTLSAASKGGFNLTVKEAK